MATNGTMSMSKKATKHQTRGFTLQCPVCGEIGATITLDLGDLATCHCESCGDDFAATTAVKILSDRLAQWTKVVQWVAMADDVMAESDPAE